MDDFGQMWRQLLPIGRSASSGGYFRQPFGAAEREAVLWFREQCVARGMTVESDDFGNLVAWWPRRPERDEQVVLTGSHLDSVQDGGAFDGPLGVVSALAAVDELERREHQPARPIGVSVFVEEEGSRFGLACLGSRLASGSTTLDAVRDLKDRDGVYLLDAMSAAGVQPAAAGGTARSLADVACFVELHVEQGRDLVHRGAPVGVASAIRPHGRYRFDFAGEANHAGTTRMEDRHDPMLTYAMTALAANKQARLADARATFGRVEVQPGSTNAVPSAVSAWLDARADSAESLDDLLALVARLATERAERDGTQVSVTAESVSGEVAFDPDLTRRLSALGGEDPWPVIPTMAGHDAGVLAAAGIPSAMLFVRNPTGVSHSPAESAEMDDCLAGVQALAAALEQLTG